MIDNIVKNILDSGVYLKFGEKISNNIDIKGDERFLETFFGCIIIKKNRVYKIFEDDFNFHRQLITYRILQKNKILQPKIHNISLKSKIIEFENIRESSQKINDLCLLNTKDFALFINKIHNIVFDEYSKKLPIDKISEKKGCISIGGFHYSNIFLKDGSIGYLDLGSFVLSDRERDLVDILIEGYYMDIDLFKDFLKYYKGDYSIDLIVEYGIKDLEKRKLIGENIHESKKIIFETWIYYFKILNIIGL